MLQNKFGLGGGGFFAHSVYTGSQKLFIVYIMFQVLNIHYLQTRGNFTNIITIHF